MDDYGISEARHFAGKRGVYHIGRLDCANVQLAPRCRSADVAENVICSKQLRDSISVNSHIHSWRSALKE